MAIQTLRTGQAHAAWYRYCSPARAPMKGTSIMAQRYQQGHLRRAKRKRGSHVWEFLWRELGPNGKRRQRTLTIGTVSDFRTERDALNHIRIMRANINREVSPTALMTF